VPPAYRAFGGSGTSLGKAVVAPTAAVVRGTGKAVTVDESQPLATIQVKLCDGRREKVVLNLRHTVADLQEHVASYVPAIDFHICSFIMFIHPVHVYMCVCRLKGTNKPFVLTAGFPPKPLTNGAQTLEEAGLKSAQVTQKEA
jgi:hypothetical protein